MYQIYSINTLKVKSLADLKAIASQVGAVAADRRSKQSWIDAILDKQPQPVEPAKTEFDVVGDEVIADGEAIASIEQDDNLTQPWVVQINGVEIFRASTWAQCFSHICWHYKQGTLPIPSEPADDYLHHDDQPIKLPQVGESHFIGNYFLRCVAVSGDCAAVWDVSVDGAVMGEIRMGWNTFWTHALSFETFTSPQEAIADLRDSLKIHEQELVPIDCPSTTLVKIKHKTQQARIMRETFTAKVRYLERKKLYTSVGLPYRSIALIDVQKEGVPVESLDFTTYIAYSQTLHDLELKSGDRIQFVARLSDTKSLYPFIRPAKYTKLSS